MCSIRFLHLLIAGLMMVGPGMGAQAEASVIPDPTPQAGPPYEFKYINSEVPDFKQPAFKGEYYEAVVPATLDLAERARLAINMMTESANPNCEYLPYSFHEHLSIPPRMLHFNQDLTCFGKYVEAVAMMRAMCGSQQNLETEKIWLKTLLKMQGPDGLMYWSDHGRPWMLSLTANAGDGLPAQDEGQDHISHIGYGNARALSALTFFAHIDPDGPWAEAARRLSGGFKRTIIEDGDIAYTFNSWTLPDLPARKPESRPIGMYAAMQAWLAEALMHHHNMLDDPEAARLATKMMRYLMSEELGEFGRDGQFLTAVGDWAHFHSHGMNIIAALHVVQETGDRELLDLALKAYHYGIRAGDGLVGFFPEAVHISGPEPNGKHPYGYLTSETCEVSDMVHIGILLSKLGIDKWDDVDRWVRNQLAENQLTPEKVSYLTDPSLDRSAYQPDDYHKGRFYHEGWSTTDRVMERSIGGFAGWPMPNDWVGHPEQYLTIMNCCNGSGARGLFYAWKEMISYEAGRLRVHLLLNRASKWADIESHIPYTGRVDIRARRGMKLEIRIPDWVRSNEARCRVDGAVRELKFDGRYAIVGDLRRGQTAVITFPIFERTMKTKIQDANNPLGSEYTLVFRGNDVVSIDPPGRICPLYKRAHYRSGQTLYRKVTRFVHDQEFEKW